MPRYQPPQRPAAVERLRLRYTKTGPMRFASHRDLARAFERVLRRAGIPVAYSSGFSPHPKISYVNAAPTGAASLAEYLELFLEERLDPDDVISALAAQLPDGMTVPEAVELPLGEAARGTKLADLLTASRWRLEIPGVTEAELDTAVRWLLDQPEVLVERETKKGLRRFDARAAITAMQVVAGGVEVLLVHGQPLVRPDDVLQALGFTDRQALATRLAQGRVPVSGVSRLIEL